MHTAYNDSLSRNVMVSSSLIDETTISATYSFLCPFKTKIKFEELIKFSRTTQCPQEVAVSLSKITLYTFIVNHIVHFNEAIY